MTFSASRRAGPSRWPMGSSRRSEEMQRRDSVQRLELRDPVAKGTVVQLKRTLELGQLTYTAPVTVEAQNMDVQIDTGTGDLWLASDRCGTSSCKGKEGYTVQLFRDDLGVEVGQSTHVSNIIGGTASGPIVVTNVSFAGTVVNQALLTATDVENIHLGEMQATGVMGLSPPLGSLVQSVLGTNSSGQNNSMTDTTRTGSVLPGLMDTLPDGSRFFSLGLQRLPSDGGNGNSTLVFGGYDDSYLPANNHRDISWSAVAADGDGMVTEWRLIVNDFLLSVNGSTIQIPLARTGANVVTAVLDSGSPLNFANAGFLNAVYGAYGVGPAADGTGEYYVDCATEILMTINVGNVNIPIHPLDASLRYSNVPGSSGDSACIGSFQAFPQGVDSDTVGANLVLGAPFLRSAYSIYSCEAHTSTANETGWCSNPTVGLYPLYNASAPSWQTALNDFNKVRKDGQQLGDNSIVTGSSTKSSGGFGYSAKIAVGVICGLVGIVGVMAILLCFLKRRRRKMNLEAAAALDDGEDANEKDAIHGDINWNKLSENERIKARELAMLHGRFVEEPDDGRHSPMMPTRAQDDWDVSSKGYWEARAIVNEYRKREQERERQSSVAAKSLSGSGASTSAGLTDDEHFGDSESHEMIAPVLPHK